MNNGLISKVFPGLDNHTFNILLIYSRLKILVLVKELNLNKIDLNF